MLGNKFQIKTIIARYKNNEENKPNDIWGYKKHFQLDVCSFPNVSEMITLLKFIAENEKAEILVMGSRKYMYAFWQSTEDYKNKIISVYTYDFNSSLALNKERIYWNIAKGKFIQYFPNALKYVEEIAQI